MVVQDLALHYQPSLSLYWLLPMQFVDEYSRQLYFYQMIHYPVMIWLTETIIQRWEQYVEIQALMKGHFCYKTCDNAEVTLWYDVVVVPVSKQTHPPCIHKYCDLHSWWTAVALYLIDQVKSDQVLKKLANIVLCSVKSWMTVDKPRKYQVD